MRMAIRGDFERLEQRRGTQELMHVREPDPEPEPDAAHEQDPVDVEAELPPRSWLARLLAAIPPRQV